ncbi:F0F1 ATP synthase subunit B [Thermobrachium celere]|uniref:ATP synthase subunit b n=1 Tax=Thermobrachium celere DSM 8682 TaxID=941824 RepID=R7RPS1_9CLOT|nr:F0F1 ATP synthase subunit B [Thermobrachium celere]GFR35952.1 ATP synthase subunit b [Thermobrachium celere]CDF57323.1 ATP synthase B chain [Thermobrachium celere DSM 8682]
MEINLWTVVITIFNVVILYIFLKKKLFIPVTTFMENRTNTIENNIKSSINKKKEAEELKKEYENKLKELNEQGKRIVEEYKNKALNIHDEIIAQAKKEADFIRQKAREDAELEMERAQDEIKKQIVSLALLVAAKAIERELDEEKHHALIKEFINRVGA